jgi:uncharacterized membrane protein
VPNVGYLTVHFVYHLALAIWIGGTIVLGALVAPALFRTLPRLDAGALFGKILRTFARVRLVAIVLAIAAAAVQHFAWETHASTPWIAVRWAALGFLAFQVLYEIGWLEKAMEARRVHLSAAVTEDHPERRAFNALHKRAEALMKAATLAAAVAAFVS